MRKYYLLPMLVVFSAWLGVQPTRAWAAFDNTTCTVRSGDDNVESFNSLRRKVVTGWNQNEQDGIRFCTQLIQCSGVDVITLESPLDFNNPNAMDCQSGPGKPAVCGDGWALIVDGGPASVNIDVTHVSTGTCAISLHGNHIKMTRINIVATRAQINNKNVLCDDGANNDIGDVTINGERPHPSPTPRPTPHPTPTPTPHPTPTPTPVPTATPQPTATPVPTATPEPTPTAAPSPAPTPEPSHTPMPSESPGPKTSPIPVNPGNDNGGPSVGAGGCDGGGWGCTVAQADTWFQVYSIYLMTFISLAAFGILRRLRRRIRNRVPLR